jgi:hypothetical protein
MNDTIIGLLGYITWILVLLVWLAVYRTLLVAKKQQAVNDFKADGSNSPAFGERLARTQGNCVESFAFIGGLMLLALATDSAVITNGFFLAQIGICFYWVVLFAFKFIGV